MKIRTAGLIFIIFSFAFPVFSETVVRLEESAERIGAADNFYYATGSQELPAPERWNLFPRNGISLNTTESSVYIKFKVTGEGSWYAELPYPPLDYVEFFEYRDGSLHAAGISGDHLPFKERTVKNRNHVFRFDLNDSQVHTFVIRVTSTSLILIEPQLWSQEAFITKERNTQLMHGLYIGSLFILVLYNIFILYSVRDLTYFYYVGYLFMNLSVFLTFHGFSFEYIWPEGILINHYAMVFSGLLGTASAVEYSRHLLKMNLFSKTGNRFLKGYVVFLLITALMTLILPIRYSITGSTLLGLFSIAVMIFFGLLRLQKGYRPAMYFVAAWMIFTGASVLHLLKNVGIVPPFIISNHGIMIGTIGQALVFSFALADRINILENEKQESRLILVQQSRMAVMGEMIGAIAHQWKQPLSHITLLTEDIEEMYREKSLSQDILENITGKIHSQVKFMDDTINDFRNFFKPSGGIVSVPAGAVVKEMLSLMESFSRTAKSVITLDGDTEARVYAYPNELKHVILNLLNNSLYAIRQQCESDREYRGNIKIIIRKTDKYVNIITSDNGGGFEPAVLKNAFRPYVSTKGDKGTGLGLYLSRMLVEQMGGKIILENSGDGASVTVALRKAD